jgi:pilus assembly protein Flp/PilA
VSEHTDEYRNDRGAAAIEYALLASLIAIAILTGATAIGVRLDQVFTEVANAF